MSYLKYLAMSFHRITDNAEIAPEHKPQMLIILQLSMYMSWTSQLKPVQTASTTRFISENHSNTVTCFTDGAITGSEVGAGCAAAIVILPGLDNSEVQATGLMDKITDSIETELTATALEMERVIDPFTSGSVDARMNTSYYHRL